MLDACALHASPAASRLKQHGKNSVAVLCRAVGWHRDAGCRLCVQIKNAGSSFKSRHLFMPRELAAVLASAGRKLCGYQAVSAKTQRAENRLNENPADRQKRNTARTAASIAAGSAITITDGARRGPAKNGREPTSNLLRVRRYARRSERNAKSLECHTTLSASARPCASGTTGCAKCVASTV
jgi:hypothetical protein